MGLRVCGNDGLCGLVKQRRWGSLFAASPGELAEMAQAQLGQRESEEDLELCVGYACLLPPCPNLSLELQTCPPDQDSHLPLPALPERSPAKSLAP